MPRVCARPPEYGWACVHRTRCRVAGWGVTPVARGRAGAERGGISLAMEVRGSNRPAPYRGNRLRIWRSTRDGSIPLFELLGDLGGAARPAVLRLATEASDSDPIANPPATGTSTIRGATQAEFPTNSP